MDKEQKEPSVKKNLILKLDKIASMILLLGVFLTPILYFPLLNFSPEVFKKFFLTGTVVIALLLWLLARFKEKKVLLVKSSIFATGGIFLLLALVSSLLSNSLATSLVGLGFESGTWLSLAILFGLMFLVAEYTRSKQKFLNVYLGLFVVFSLAFLFQAVRLIFGNWLPWPIFDNGAMNLIGKWNDLGVLAGLVALSSIIILELFPLQEAKAMKNFIWGVLGAAVLTMVLVNFSLIWIVLAVVLILVYSYNISFLSRQASGGRKIMKISLVVFLISLAFIIFGRPISYDVQGAPHEGYLATQTRKLAEKIQISYLEVRPSVTGTYSLTKNSLKLNPVFGSGPNTFSAVWLKNKPAGVNESQFWNIEPAFGVGFLPSFFVTTGLAGGLALILFVLLLAYLGVKALINPQTDSLEKSFLMLSFAGLIYVWAFLILYVPETSMLAIAFVVTGLFMARLVDLKEIKTKEIALSANPKVKFMASLAGAVIGLVLVLLIGVWLTTAGALLAFQRATNALQITGDADRAEKYINVAIRLNPQDIYYRLAVQANVAQMSILLNDKKIAQTELMTAVSKIFETAKKNADAAVTANKQNYLNYVVRGSLYENIMSLGVNGAYELAKENYTTALTYNPHGPDMYLNLARLEIANKNYTAAEKYLDQSLGEKKNYIDAIFLQSQLYAQRGFLDSAITRAKYASQLAPADVSVLFQLGYLQYRNADYRDAMTTFKSAVALVPDFANAKYFLGLSYDKLGLTDSAIKEFVAIQKNNPDNAEVKQILTNLRAGRDALAGAEPVEKKVSPPVKQD